MGSLFRVFLCGFFVLGLACKKRFEIAAPRYVVEQAGIGVPEGDGWVVDASVKAAPEGGIAFRLVRQGAVPGSPRIDVILAAPRANSGVDEFLTRNLQEMAQLETDGKLRILSVTQKEVRLQGARAFLVRHEYTVGEGSTQVAISQLALFAIARGRGVAVSAAGRTELFAPLAPGIEQILLGVTLLDAQPAPAPVAAPKAPNGSTTTGEAPIDLGKIGGKK